MRGSSPLLSIRTARLHLVAGNEALSRAELEDRSRLAALLGAEVPPEWPPPLNDEASIRFSLEMHRTCHDTGGWANWYFLLESSAGHRIAVGNGGFRGPPTPAGRVEIGYSILECHQRRGMAKEAVDALVAWAFANKRVRVVQAQTLPELEPSIRVLEKCGFHFVGPGSDEGAILYELPRPPEISEVWLSGPVPGVPPLLVPVAHALLQARADVRRLAVDIDCETLWARPGNAASVGFHVLHLAGSLDRLFTYAREEALTAAQRDALTLERHAGDTGLDAAALVRMVDQAVDAALAQLRHTEEHTLIDPRRIGKAQLPTTVLGLLFHAAEHCSRHVGQIATTLKLLQAK